jgi:hypothetical protein
MRRIIRFYALFIILIPGVLMVVAIPPLLFSCVTIISCCLAKQGKNIPKYHGQPKYLSRLQARCHDLEKITIEELNERRFSHPRMDKVHRYNGNSTTTK